MSGKFGFINEPPPSTEMVGPSVRRMIRAKAEVSKHVEELTIAPLPPPEPRRRGEKRAEIHVRVKTDGLLGPQEAVVYAVDWLRGLDLNQRPLGYEGKSGHQTHRHETMKPKQRADLADGVIGLLWLVLGRPPS